MPVYHDFEIHTHYANSASAKIWKHKVITKDDVLHMLENPGDRKAQRNTPSLFFGRLEGNARNKDSVISKSAIVLDADHAPGYFADFANLALDAWAHFLHTTYSSTPDKPRYRVIIPLAEEISPSDYTYYSDIVTSYLETMIDPGIFDKTAREPSRLFYAPATHDPESYSYIAHDGDHLITPGELEALNLVLDTPVEREAPQDTLTPSSGFDPAEEIVGVVGEFNSLYIDDLDSCIEDYDLPYTRVGDKWHFNGSKSEPGLIDLGDGYYYSHHATDPANGERLTAYDLVRIHVYEGKKTAIEKALKSDKRILDLRRQKAVELSRTVFEPVTDEALSALLEGDSKKEETAPVASSFFTAIEPEEVEESKKEDPKTSSVDFAKAQEQARNALIDFNKDTLKFESSVYNLDVLKSLDPVVSHIARNELTADTVCSVPTPWGNKAGDPIETADISSLCLYLERTYRLDISQYRVEVLVNDQANHHRYHPVKQYLDSLEWDGTPRLETALPGVVPNDYTRMVARKCLTAAVARIYEPGIKWDYVMVIQGSQGLGKTYWIEKMSRGFYTELGEVGRADTIRELHQSWISVSDEASTISKGDFDKLKDFMTRTHDTYRLPYDKRSRSVPRSSVIWATTNHEDFIPEFEEGTRRFLAVKSTQKVDFSAMTEEYISQVWAEAKHLYQNGEVLFLDDDQEAVAAKVREQYTANSGFGGALEEFISSPISEDWDKKSVVQRIEWLKQQAAGMEKGTSRRTEISAAQYFCESSYRPVIDAKPGEIEKIDRYLKMSPHLELISTKYPQPGYGSQPVYKIIDYPMDARNYEKEESHSGAGSFFDMLD